MPFYHFRFLEDGGRVVLGEDQDCADEQAALARAHYELEQRSYRQVEVWFRDQRIASIGASRRPAIATDERQPVNIRKALPGSSIAPSP